MKTSTKLLKLAFYLSTAAAESDVDQWFAEKWLIPLKKYSKGQGGFVFKVKDIHGNIYAVKFTTDENEIKRIQDIKNHLLFKETKHLPVIYEIGTIPGGLEINGVTFRNYYIREHFNRIDNRDDARINEIRTKRLLKDTDMRFYPDDIQASNIGFRGSTWVYMDPTGQFNPAGFNMEEMIL